MLSLARLSRPALAVAVALLCTLAVAIGPGLLDESGAASGAAAVPNAAPAPPPAGHGAAPPGLGERELREIETATLGAEHAREHALMRAARRREERAGGEQAGSTARPAAATAAAALAPPDDPDEVGRWETAKANFPVVAIHAAVLPTGKVMLFSYPTGNGDRDRADAWLWTPATGQLEQKNPPDLNGKPANIWCAGQTFTADGELLVFGGNLEYSSPGKLWKGLDKVYTFNPWTETWRQQDDMEHGRWYPSGIRLANGTVPIINGLDESGRDPASINPDVELFTPPAAAGGMGTVAKIGTLGGSGPPIGDLYPRMFLMPDGHVQLAGPDPWSTYKFTQIGPSGFSWFNTPDLSRWRIWGTAVPMPAGPGGSSQIMALGGTAYTPAGVPAVSTSTTEIFDESKPTQPWQPAASNLIGRGHANTVLLADGSMAQIGGGIGSDPVAVPQSPLHAADPEQRQVELWDPETKDWRLGPAQTESRAYHSTAVLLPDATVLSAGDEFNGDGAHTDTGEIYTPPYLFRGPQPLIGSAPEAIDLGATFGVDTANTNIARAALVAPGAVTHGVDMNQRYIGLTVERRSGCVRIAAPSDPDVAPPGWYMLFLINDQGVPSDAKFVRLVAGGAIAHPCNGAAPPADVTPPTLSLSSPAGGITVTGPEKLKATAADNVGVVGVQFKRDNVNIGAEDKTAPYTLSWDTTQVANGPHEVSAVARDAAGNVSTQASVTVTVSNVDQTPPSVQVDAPAPGAVVSGAVDFAATASDLNGIEWVQFTVDGVDVGPADTLPPYAISWPSGDRPNGNHTIRARAIDPTGNVTTSAPVVVNVRNGPPAEPWLPEPQPDPAVPAAPPGNPPAVAPPPPDLAPALSHLKLSRAVFRKGTDATIGFRLSEAAKVTVAFERKLSGHRVRGRCVTPVRKGRARCTLYRRARTTIRLQGKAGANSVLLPGRLSRSLAAGSWRLAVRATDAAGKHSPTIHAGFRLIDARVKKVRAAALSWF